MQTSHTSEARGECVTKIGEYVHRKLWEIVEEWKEHCTVTNRTLVLSSIYIHHLLKMEHQTKTELVSDF